MLLRPAGAADEPLLWEMLYEASYAADLGIRGPADLAADAHLARYVAGWGRASDLGIVDVARRGAAWARLLTGDDAGYGYVDDGTPEVAIAVAPGARGSGLGGALLRRLMAEARPRYEFLSLSVRLDNPARRLYTRLGFEPVREPDDDPTASITMRARLR